MTTSLSRSRATTFFLRRNARVALSKKTDDGLALIGSLVARDDNYRLQLGAAVALADVPLPVVQKGPPAMLNKLRALRGSSDRAMRDAAVQAALKARFSPTKLSGQPVKVSGVINYKFALVP